MAKVKNVYATHVAAAFRLNVPRTNILAAFPENGEYIHLADYNLDPNTAYPVQNISPSGIPAPYSLATCPTSFVSTKPIALARQNQTVHTPEINYPQVEHGNVQYRTILDKDKKAQTGNVIRFEDSAGAKHFVHSANYSQLNYRMYGTLSIGEGNNFLGQVVSYTVPYSTVLDYGGTQKASKVYAAPVYVDASAKKVIYWTQYKYTTSTLYPGIGMPGFSVGSFTTNPVDGQLSLDSEPVSLGGLPIAHPGNTGPINQYGEPQQIFYCGDALNGNPCFMLVSENEVNYVSNNTANNWATSTNWTKATYGSRITFVEYSVAANSTTIIAGPLGANTSWSLGGGASTISAGYGKESFPTHFEPSPIAGEDNVYYCFLPVVDSTYTNTNFIVCRWNKGTSSFTAYPCSIDMNGQGAISDYFFHAAKNGLTLSCPMATLTTDGDGNLFLSVFNQHNGTRYTTYSGDARYNNCVTFSVAASNNLRNLTFHSSASFTALGVVAKDSNCRTLHMISAGSAKVMTWNSINGWTASGTYPGLFYAITEDANGAVWGISSTDNDLYTPTTPYVYSNPLNATAAYNFRNVPFTLELLAPDLPNSVQVYFEDASISYAGSPVQKNIIVNAFDATGTRIAALVTLKISGPNAVFTSNSSTTLQITTSAAGNTSVGLTINAAGYLNVSGSFAV